MNSWTSIKDIRKKLEREWVQGKLLAPRVTGEEICPKRFVLKKPQTKEWAEKWDAALAWASSFNPGENEGRYKIEWKEVNLRLLGKNRFPNALIFETESSMLKTIGKLQDAKVFDELCLQIFDNFPELKSWVVKRPLVVLCNRSDWSRLLAVLHHLKTHPRPGIYVRQLEIPEVDTKFIETHKKLLGELLDRILPEEVISFSATGVKKFEERYGFLAKPLQIRFRILDSELYLHGLSDLHVTISEFQALNLAVEHVFITENEINGLAFPHVRNAIIIFGLGFGLDRLANIDWLQGKNIHYWGDIDTHGYVMLDQLRCYFSRTRSFLMDRETLMAHKFLWGHESKPTKRSLTRLDKEERDVYELLVNNVLSDSLRLEQERVSYSFVIRILKKIGVPM